MQRLRLPRRLVAIVSIVALVAAQALVSAYACVPTTPADAAAEPCHEPVPEPTFDSLCKAHCEAGQQNVDQPKLLATPDLATPVLVVAVADLSGRGSRSSAQRSAWLAHAGAPPPLLLTGRLRI